MSKELKIGIVAVIVIAGFIWGYNFLKGQNLFNTDTRYFNVEYPNISGLTKSSFVTINGLKVGTIDKIEFNPNPEKKGQLVVRFSVKKDFNFSKESVVKIYSPSPLSPSNLAIVPHYEGENAKSEDYLKGEIESSLFTSLGERLDPLQAKLEHVIISADSLFKNVNNVLDLNTQNSLKVSVKNLETTLTEVKKTMLAVNGVIDKTTTDLTESVKNTKAITENFSKISDTIVNANIGGILKKAEVTLNSANLMLSGINKGKGTLGKLVTDEDLYNNITSMSKELEDLLREMKLNPKRFVHFSLFGKKAKPYAPNKDVKLKQEVTK
ncbi:MlaD family protein [uncultured Polaribacter sp.]|uniref:MlaD family protein n=1 Tax=uncultured Polaribacter sp. TaxID=174711 RepID=UPI0026257FCD|nr:MlaD family protein [uncultured Polaribacter sp.]